MEREERRRTDSWFKAFLVLLGILQAIGAGWIAWATSEIQRSTTKIAVIETTIGLQYSDIVSRLDRMEKKR